MRIQLGKVTIARRGKLHADMSGWARCGSGQGRILVTTRRELTAETGLVRICRHCRPYLLDQLNIAAITASADHNKARGNADLVIIDAIRESLITQAERDAREARCAEMVTVIRQRMAAHAGEVATVWAPFERMLADAAETPALF